MIELYAGDLVTVLHGSTLYYGYIQALDRDTVYAHWSSESSAKAWEYYEQKRPVYPMPRDQCELVSAGGGSLKKQCVCTSHDLFRYGCRCGAIKPYKSEV